MKQQSCTTARHLAGLQAYGWAPPAPDPEAGRLHKQEALWREASTLPGARRVDLKVNVAEVLPDILHAAATCEGDYCDLGETVYRLLNQALRQASK